MPVRRAVFHFVQLFLHVRGELYIDDVGKVFAHQVVDNLAKFRRNETLVFARHG